MCQVPAPALDGEPVPELVVDQERVGAAPDSAFELIVMHACRIGVQFSRQLILGGLAARQLGEAIPVVFLSVVHLFQIVRRNTNAAVVTPYSLRLIGNGRLGFQILHAGPFLSLGCALSCLRRATMS